MIKELLIDTNILVYAYDSTQGEKHIRANRLVADVFAGKIKAHITTQILGELFITLVKGSKNPMPKKMVEEIIGGIIESNNWIKLSANPLTIIYTTKLYQEGFHFWDCLIAATAIQNLVTTIYTENVKDFEKIPGIEVINPLR